MPKVAAVRAAVLTALGVAVSEAWPGLRRVWWRPPGETEADLPYAVLVMRETEAQWSTVQSLLWPIAVDVYGVFPKGPVDWAEEGPLKFDALALKVESSEVFAGVAELPVLSGFDPSPGLDASEGAYAVRCGFTCQAHVDWGAE